MSDTKHTPTPYTQWELVVAAEGASFLADCSTGSEDPEVCKANAAFIVRACNSHETLCAALDENLDTVKMLRAQCTPGSDVDDVLFSVVTTCEAALKLARGES